MKSRELMIGDWVRCSDPTPFRVQGIYNDDPWMVEDEQGLKVCLGDVEPIPLTEEILVKNDFVFYESNNSLCSSCYFVNKIPYVLFNVEQSPFNEEGVFSQSIGYYEENGERAITDSQVIFQTRYVHQLQHALRLCGLTELADNFKVEGGAE